MDRLDRLAELERRCFDAAWRLHRAHTSQLFAIMCEGMEGEVECREKSMGRIAEAVDNVRFLHQAMGEWLEEIPMLREISA